MSEIYNGSEVKEKLAMVEHTVLDVLNHAFDSEISDELKKQIFDLLCSSDSKKPDVASKHYEVFNRLFSKRFSVLSNSDFTQLLETAMKYLVRKDNFWNTYKDSEVLGSILDCKSLFDNFSDFKYGENNAYIYMINKFAESEYGILKCEAVLKRFSSEDSKNEILDDKDKLKILGVVDREPLEYFKNKHDALSWTSCGPGSPDSPDLYSFFMDPRTLAVDDKLYNDFFAMCQTFYCISGLYYEIFQTAHYKTAVANEMLLKGSSSAPKFEITMEYLYKVLKDGLLGFQKKEDKYGYKIPLAIGEVLDMGIIKVVDSKNVADLTDEDLKARLDRITSADNPVLEGFIMMDLNDDKSKGDIARSVYNSMVEGKDAKNGREQMDIYKFISSIKDFPEIDFQRLLSIYKENPKAVQDISTDEMWLQNLDGLEYIVKRLTLEQETFKKEHGNDYYYYYEDKRVPFLQSFLYQKRNERLISLYPVGIIANFIELGLSFHSAEDGIINLYDEYSAQNDVDLPKLENEFDSYADYKKYKSAKPHHSRGDRMTSLLCNEQIKDMSTDERREHAYTVLYGMTNCDLFSEEIGALESSVQAALTSQGNKAKKMIKVDKVASGYLALASAPKA